MEKLKQDGKTHWNGDGLDDVHSEADGIDGSEAQSSHGLDFASEADGMNQSEVHDSDNRYVANFYGDTVESKVFAMEDKVEKEKVTYKEINKEQYDWIARSMFELYSTQARVMKGIQRLSRDCMDEIRNKVKENLQKSLEEQNIRVRMLE